MTYVFLAISGVALWALWRIASRRSSNVRVVVAAGFVLRALAGVALFFISWAQLPVARPLQGPGGLWFFAADAETYMGQALIAADGGIGTIVSMRRMPPSPFFVQSLAAGAWLLGAFVSVALLLNALAYLGAMAALAKSGDERAVWWPIAAISLSPSLILWSTQPLKDTLLTMLFVGVFVAGLAWQKAWIEQRNTLLVIVAVLAFWICTWGIGGIRWPVGLVMWMLTPILILVIFRTRARIATAFGSIGLVLFIATALVFGGEWLVPHHVYEAAHDVVENRATWSSFPRALVRDLGATKRAFDSTKGATDLEKPKPKPKPSAHFERRRQYMAARAPRVVTTQITTSRRVFLGIVAMTVPPTLVRSMGLFDVGGGRGLWLFADVDTIVFDVVLVAAILAIVRRPRQALSTPMVWYVGAIAVAFFFLLPYLVTNYGSLFRYRSIVYVSLAFLPLAAQSLRPS